MMDYKEQFAKLVEENRYEEARIALEKLKYNALEDPFYYANMGWILNHMERYQEAEVMLRKGIAVFPEDAWMYSQLGFCLDRLGFLDEGLTMLLTSLKRGFDEPWIHGEIGWCYKEKGDFKKAVEHFEDGLMDDEQNAFILSQAADAYASLGDMDTAEDYYKKSYLYAPDNNSLFDLANFYRQTQKYEREIEYLLQIEDAQENPGILFELGAAYYELHDFDKALSYLEKAMELGRDDTAIRAKLGDVYLALHKKKESDEQYNIALGYYEKALKREEDTYWIYQEMIWIAHKQKDMKKKHAYLMRASKEHEMTLWLMYHFARCYSDMGENKKAADACKYCIEEGEDGKEMYDLYAWNLGRCDCEKEAVQVLKECMEKYEPDDWNYGELGWNYAQLKEYEKARDCFYKAVELSHDNAMHISMLGWCCLRLQQYEEAARYVKQSMDLGRNDGWIHSVYAEVCEGQEKYEEAIHHYQYAIDHDYNEDWIHEEIKELKTKRKNNA